MEYTQVRVSKDVRKRIRLLSIKYGIDVPTLIEMIVSKYEMGL